MGRVGALASARPRSYRARVMTPFQTQRPRALAALGLAVLLGAVPVAEVGRALGAPPAVASAGHTPLRACAPDPDPPEYYAIPLVTTKNVPGTAYTRGTADVTFAPSPFGIAVSPDGSYAYDVHVAIPDLREPGQGRYVAWVTTTQVDQIRRLGELENGRITGRVDWNKFLVVITLESDPDPSAERWSGPIAFRGMSRSGKMHTMAGHGPFEEEKCATYGYS